MLKNGGYVLIHHSNLANDAVKIQSEKSERWNENPHARSLISAEDVKYISEKHGFAVVEQCLVDWGGILNLDCITLLKKQPKSKR